MSFEFEYGSSGGTHGARRGAPRKGSGRRRAGMVWILWLMVAASGTGVSVAMALRVGEVRAVGDAGFWTAVIGILAVLILSLPGFSMYWLARSSAYPNWHERVWRPTALVRLSLISSVAAALWCGYLIAIRIAREWPA